MFLGFAKTQRNSAYVEVNVTFVLMTVLRYCFATEEVVCSNNLYNYSTKRKPFTKKTPWKEKRLNLFESHVISYLVFMISSNVQYKRVLAH